MGDSWERYKGWRQRRLDEAEENGTWPYKDERAYQTHKLLSAIPFWITVGVFGIAFLVAFVRWLTGG